MPILSFEDLGFCATVTVECLLFGQPLRITLSASDDHMGKSAVLYASGEGAGHISSVDIEGQPGLTG